MKRTAALLAVVLALGPAHAVTAKKSKDTAFALTWTQNAKTYAGKKVTTVILEVEDPGAIAEDAPCAAVKVVTGNARGEAGGDIIALMPAKDLGAFIQKVNAVTKGKSGGFGAKISYPTHTPTFTTIEGEPVLVFGDTPKTGGKKPSELLAAQQAAAQTPTETPQGEDPKPADKKKNDDRKPLKKPAK